MSYVKDNLNGNEIIEFSTGLSRLSVMLYPVISLIIGKFLLGSPELGVSWQWVGLGALCWGVCNGLVRLRRIMKSQFAITNQRIFMKESSGIPLVMPFSEIDSITVDQNIRGRILGYGTVIIGKKREGSRKFENVSKPFDFKQHILDHVTIVNDGSTSREVT